MKFSAFPAKDASAFPAFASKSIKQEIISENLSNKFDNWLRGRCQFTCSMCGLVILELEEFSQHLQKEHTTTIEEHVKRFGDPCTKKVISECKICGQKMRHDRQMFKLHIEGEHKMSLVKYFEKIVEEKKDQIDARGSSGMGQINVDVKINVMPKTSSVTSRELSDAAADDDDDDDDIEFLGEVAGNGSRGSISVKPEPTELADHSIDSTNNRNSISSADQNDTGSTKGIKTPWYSGTLFECKICQSQFLDMPEVKRHISTAHEMSLDDVIHTYGEVIIATNVHECEVCGRGMQHSGENIRNHLKVHGLSLGAYYDRFSQELDSAAVDLATPLPITCPVLIGKLSRKKPVKSAQSEDSVDQSLNHDWLNKCLFTCKLCPDFHVKVLATLVSHLKATHNLKTVDYKEKFGPMITHSVYHVCQICGTVQRWERSSIYQHLSRNHWSITVDDYVVRYKDTYTENPTLKDAESEQWMNQCTFKCLEDNCTQKFNVKSKFGLHLALDHNLTTKQYYDKHHRLVTKAVYMQCKICSKMILWENRSIKSHLWKKHSMDISDYSAEYITEDEIRRAIDQGKETRESSPADSNNEWIDKCLFACRVCYTTVGNRKSFRDHLSEAHLMTETSYSDHFDSSLLQKVIHSCMICHVELLFDSLTMSNHFQRNHNFTIEEYLEAYLNKYKQASPPSESDWMERCLYYCNLCLKVYKGKHGFKQHIITEHFLTGIEQQLGNCVLEETTHVCQAISVQGQVCGKEVIWCQKSLAQHLNKHNLTPEAYNEKYMNQYEAEQVKTLASEQMNWTDKCMYLCNVCNKKFKGKREIESHMEMLHQTANTDSPILKFLLHTCQICDQNVLWESEAVQSHVEKEHGLNTSEYFSKYLKNYRENEACSKEVSQFYSWMNRCQFRCCICAKHGFDSKSKLRNHLRQHHPSESAGYFTKYEEEIVLGSLHHVCQICTRKFLWDKTALEHHIIRSHKMSTDVYRAKYLKDYTEDEEALTRARKEERKAARLTKLIKRLTTTDEKNKSSNLHNDDDSDDEDESLPEDVQTWSRGCLYSCQMCESDFVGVRQFELHLRSTHSTSIQNYRRQYGITGSNAIVGYHFCKLCSTNVRHDTNDLSNHFKKMHNNMNIVEYYNQFKAKLRMPRLERVVTSKDGLSEQIEAGNNESTVEGMKRKQSEKSSDSETQNSSAKKFRSENDSKSCSSDSSSLLLLEEELVDFVQIDEENEWKESLTGASKDDDNNNYEKFVTTFEFFQDIDHDDQKSLLNK